MLACVCRAQVLAQLQECPQVCRLVPGGEGTWEGRSYLLMELLGLNLAMYQRAHPHNGRINPPEAKRIGVAPPSRLFWEKWCSLESSVLCMPCHLAHQRQRLRHPCAEADRLKI